MDAPRENHALARADGRRDVRVGAAPDGIPRAAQVDGSVATYA
jgi:hypothetical protein